VRMIFEAAPDEDRHPPDLGDTRRRHHRDAVSRQTEAGGKLRVGVPGVA
jgi:hypothetical protein